LLSFFPLVEIVGIPYHCLTYKLEIGTYLSCDC
jgi:hypothetical protein